MRDYRGDTGQARRGRWPKALRFRAMMAYRGRPRGEPSAALPPDAFVAFIQNHDQIGNRAFGERLTRARRAAKRCAPWPPSTCCCRRCRCCSWARNGRRRSRFRSSATSAPIWPTPCATDGARSSPAFAAFRDPAMRDAFPDPTARGNLRRCQTRLGRRAAGAACRLARLVLPGARHAAGRRSCRALHSFVRRTLPS